MGTLDGKRIAILATDGVEQVEAGLVAGRTLTSYPPHLVIAKTGGFRAPAHGNRRFRRS